MDSDASALQSLKTPIKLLFVLGNGLVWTAFSFALILHWALLPASSRWSGVLLAISFLSLGWSLLKGNDQASNQMYFTLTFFTTMLTVSRLF